VPKPPVSKPPVVESRPDSKVDALVEATKNAVIVNMDVKKFGQWLDRQLQGMFDAVAEEPIPQSLIDLIKDQGEPKA